MSSPIGDTIELLSVSTPLTAGSTWTSSCVVLGQYNSLNIVVTTDADAVLHVEWSGDDGVNWDYSNAYSIAGTVPKRIIISTIQKCVRYRLVNGSDNENYLRLTTYGTTTSNSVVISLDSLISINGLPVTQFGELPVANMEQLIEYHFYAGTGATTCLANNLVTTYPDLYTVGAPFADAACGVDATNHCLYMTSGLQNGTGGIIFGKQFNIPSVTTFLGRVTCSFTYGDVTDTNLTVGFGRTGSNNTPTAYSNILIDGCHLGWKSDTTTGPHTYDNFSLIIGNLIIPRTEWNVDKLDGSKSAPIDLTQPNTFQIIMSSFGNVSLYVQDHILDINHSRFILLHREFLNNSSFRPYKPPIGFLTYSYNGATPTTECQVNVFEAGIIATLDRTRRSEMSLPVRINSTALGGAERLLGVFRLLSTFGSNAIYTAVDILSLNVVTSGTNPVTLRIYLDGTPSGTAFSQPNTYLPVELSTAGSYVASNRLIYTFELGANDSKTFEFPTMTPFIYGFRYVVATVYSATDTTVTATFNLASP